MTKSSRISSGGVYKSKIPVGRRPNAVGERKGERLCPYEVRCEEGVQTNTNGSQRLEFFGERCGRGTCVLI